MNVFRIEETSNTPLVYLDHKVNRMLFEGDSRPENVQQFYTPILDWLSAYENYLSIVQSAKIIVNFKLEYYNSSSAKYLMNVLTKMNKLNEMPNISLELNWHYDPMDEDMLDSGEEFEGMFNLKFNFIEID